MFQKNRKKVEQPANSTITMKTLTKTALLAVGMAVAAQGAHAANNDLIIGFDQPGVSATDYTVDLGNFSTVGLGKTTTTTLSSDLNMTSFNTAFSSPNGVAVAVVGGNNGVGTKDVLATAVRTGNNPAAQAGSATPTTLTSSAQVTGAGAKPNGISPLGLGSAGSTTSWDSLVSVGATDNGTTSSDMVHQMNGYNPMGVISGNTIMLDLYDNTLAGSTVGGWLYQGFFTLTFTGSGANLSDTLTFTPATLAVAVPEPATYGVLAGFGLLALSLRRQLSRKTA
jgi:hypothetical protein